MAGGDFKTNTLIVPKAAPSELSEFEDPKSIFGLPATRSGAAESWRRVYGLP